MRFRTDSDGRIVKASARLRSFDHELADHSLPPQLVDNGFAGTIWHGDVLVWEDTGVPVWLLKVDGTPAEMPEVSP